MLVRFMPHVPQYPSEGVYALYSAIMSHEKSIRSTR
jgi:hypothetical protein